MKKTTLILSFIMVLLSSSVLSFDLFDSFESGTMSISTGGSDGAGKATRFTAIANYTAFVCQRFADYTGNPTVRCELWNRSGGEPGSRLFTFETRNGLDTGIVQNNFTNETGFEIVQGTLYYIVIMCVSNCDADNKFLTKGLTSGGVWASTTDFGASWQNTGLELRDRFSIYGLNVSIDPPTNSTLNVTSPVPAGESRVVWNTAGSNIINATTNNMSVTFTLDIAGNSSMDVDVERNYTGNLDNNILTKCETTETVEQSCAYYGNLTPGLHCLYLSHISPIGFETASGTSSSGCLNFTYYESPTVYLINPSNLFNTSNQLVNFTFNTTVTGLSSILNATLYHNGSGSWSSNQTITSITNATITNFSINNFSTDGDYKWNVYVCSTKNLCAWNSTNFTFTIDTTSPVVTIIHPTNSTTYNKDDIDLNWIYSDALAFDWCAYSLNGTTNITISTNITLNNLSENTHNVTMWCNDTVGHIGQSNITFFTVNLQYSLFMDGLSQDRKYEFGTTANLTTANFSENVCFDILDDTNRYLNVSCGTDSTYNYTIDKLVINIFNDSSTIKNVTNTSTSVFSTINNKTDLVDLEFNISGFSNGSYPQNISIDIGNDNVTDAIIPGRIIGVNYEINTFFFNNINYKAFNLTYVSQGNKQIFLNITSSGNRTSNGTLNFTMTVFDLDVGNDFDYNENFSSELGSTFTVNLSQEVNSPGVWDDFNTNKTFNKYNWFQLDTSKTYFNQSNGINISCSIGDGFCLRNSVGSPSASLSSSVHPYLDLRLINQITFESKSRVSCSWTPSPGCQHAEYRTGFFGETDEEFIPFATAFVSCGSAGSKSTIHTRKYTIWKTDINTFKVKYGTTTTTHSVSSLEGPIRLVFDNFVKPLECSCPSCGGMGSTTIIDNLNISGIMLNRSNGNYSTLNANWTEFLTVTASNIQRAKFISKELLQEDFNGILSTDTTLTYWLSNDNGTTWEPAENDTFNDFDSTGKSLKIRIQLQTNNSFVSPIISDLQVLIVPTSGCSLDIDVGGGEGGQSMNTSEGLNSTNTPIFYNGTDEFIGEFDCIGLTCNVPIRFAVNQSCMIEISNMNYTKNPNPLTFTNLTSIENSMTPEVSFSFDTGIIELRDWMLQFFGSKNITVLAFKEDDKTINDSQVIQVKYSQFNLSFPSGQSYWQIFPNKRNQSNIEPFGQNSSTGIWTVNSTAYDSPFDIYVRYNTSIDSCVVNNTFSGMNLTLNQTKHMTNNVSNLSTTYQKLIVGLNDTVDHADIFTFSDIACGGDNTAPLIIPWYCFRSRCQDCVDTFDFNETCSWSE